MEEFKTWILLVCKILIWFKICSIPAKIYLCAFLYHCEERDYSQCGKQSTSESETSKQERGDGEY